MSATTKRPLWKPGAGTFQAEVAVVSNEGISVRVDGPAGEEFFLSYDRYPWFRHGSEEQVRGVERWGEDHLHWDALDVDLHIEALRWPDRFPLHSVVMPDLPLRVQAG